MVAIDFGTTYSGYAYTFTNNTKDIHIMRKWEGLSDKLSISALKIVSLGIFPPEINEKAEILIQYFLSFYYF